MKTAVSSPDDLFARVERLPARKRMSGATGELRLRGAEKMVEAAA